MIGVVGGVGPYAGLDLVRKILDHSQANCDQDHLPVSLLSVPHLIGDRTDFLLGETSVNPGIALAKVIGSLVDQGATIIGIPCNTAHSPLIFDEIKAHLPSGVVLVNMIHEVAHYLKSHYPTIKNIGILSTTGTMLSQVYSQNLSAHQLNVLSVSKKIQDEKVQPAIYDPDYGIKAHTNPISDHAIMSLHSGLDDLVKKKAQAIILGCTEIPLAIGEGDMNGVVLIDPTRILAEALIRESDPTHS